MANSLKAVVEKRNSLVSQITDLADIAEKEVRGFNESELSTISAKKVEILELDESINKIKEVRSLSGKIENTKGDNEMEKDILSQSEVETRGMDQFLRGDVNGVELRSLKDANTSNGSGTNATSATNGQGLLVPTSVASEIIEMLGEQSPVFEQARKFTSVTGDLKIAREGDVSDEGFIGETLDAKQLVPKLKSVTLTQKRVGAALQLTNQLINDSGVDIVTYAQGRLARSSAKAIERGILVGAKDGGDAAETFSPIVGNADVLTSDVVALDTITIEELLNLLGSINPSYLAGASWTVSRAVFNAILKLKDGDGQWLALRPQTEAQPGYSLFGCPVNVSDVLNKNATSQIVFGNIGEAVGVLIKKDINLVSVTADTTQALAGGQLLIMDAYMDSAVINPKAVVVAKKL